LSIVIFFINISTNKIPSKLYTTLCKITNLTLSVLNDDDVVLCHTATILVLQMLYNRDRIIMK